VKSGDWESLPELQKFYESCEYGSPPVNANFSHRAITSILFEPWCRSFRQEFSGAFCRCAIVGGRLLFG